MRKFAYNLQDYSVRELIKVFKTLSDETRLRILNLLTERECCVCEVMQALDISQSRASRNLNALYNAGLLKLRRDGVWSVYSIDKEKLTKCYLEIINSVVESLSMNDLTALDKQRLQNASRVGPGCVRKQSI